MFISPQAVNYLQPPAGLVLTPLTDTHAPTRVTFLQLWRECAQYLATQQTHLGGGAKGHLKIMCHDETQYNTLTNNAAAFVIPEHPGDAPQIPDNATGIQTTTANETYKRTLAEFNRYYHIQTTLLNALITAIPHIFIAILADSELGFANVTPAQILHHLRTTYSTTTLAELDANETLLESDWDPNTPIENLWLRLKRCQEFAADSEPISDKKVLRTAINIIKRTQLFDTTLSSFEKRPANERTLTNFQSDVNTADTKRRTPDTPTAGSFAGLVANQPSAERTTAQKVSSLEAD